MEIKTSSNLHPGLPLSLTSNITPQRKITLNMSDFTFKCHTVHVFNTYPVLAKLLHKVIISLLSWTSSAVLRFSDITRGSPKV